jgi:hypothetical protein
LSRGPAYHGWTHRSRLKGGTDPVPPDPWHEPTLLNGWANAGAPYDVLAYRAGFYDYTIEFKGHIEGGASGTVAFVVDTDLVPLQPITATWLNDIVSGVGFAIARIELDGASGEVTVTYPAS